MFENNSLAWFYSTSFYWIFRRGLERGNRFSLSFHLTRGGLDLTLKMWVWGVGKGRQRKPLSEVESVHLQLTSDTGYAWEIGHSEK